MRAPRLTFIDALRGIAAIAVVLVHLRDSKHLPDVFAILPDLLGFIVSKGHSGVEVFFVLSGFVIAHTVGQADVDFRYVGRFMSRRLARLGPPYWAAIGLGMARYSLAAFYRTDGSVHIPTLYEIFLHVVYAQELVGVKPIDTVFWTLSLEIQFYLTFALLLLAATKLRQHFSGLNFNQTFWIVFTPCLAFAGLWPVQAAPWSWPHGIFTDRWHLFLAGVLVARALALAAPRTTLAVAWGYILFLACASLTHTNFPLGIGVLTAGAILTCGRLGRMSHWLSYRPLQFLGTISFSLYLVHNPTTSLLFGIGYHRTPHTFWWQVAWFFFSMTVSLSVAYGFFRFIERPSMHLSKRLGRGAKSTLDQAPAASPLPAERG